MTPAGWVVVVWCGFLAVSCLWGLSGDIGRIELDAAAEVVKAEQSEMRAHAKAEGVAETLGMAVHEIKERGRDRWRGLDDCLKAMPAPRADMAPYTRMVHADWLPYYAKGLQFADLRPDAETFTTIDLRLSEFRYRGAGRIFVWERNGWFFFPKKAIEA